MADNSGVLNSSGKPVRGILKKGSKERTKPVFVEEPKPVIIHTNSDGSGIQWDEMNILMTEHPANKDYGHMKIEEPKTPYHEMLDDDDEAMATSALSPNELAEKVNEVALELSSGSSKWEVESSGSEEDLTDEQRKHQNEFRSWRKKHYNEFLAVKRAKELIAKDLAELEDDEGSPSTGCPDECSSSQQDCSMQSSLDDSILDDDVQQGSSTS